MLKRVTTFFWASACLLLPIHASAQQLQPIDLGTSANFAILTKAGISTVPPSVITGDIGVSPAAQTYITGFSLTDNTGFATSPQVTGKVYAADQAAPTPSMMTTAIGDMEMAYVDAAGRPNPDFIELHSGQIGGTVLYPGLYKWTSNVGASTNFELQGNGMDVWIFQIAGNLDVANDVIMTLAGDAQASNVFFQVAGAITFGSNTQVQGNFMTATAVNFGTSATLLGRVLAQTEVVLNMTTLTKSVLDPALPVELTSFDVLARGSSAVLNWVTASETNNAGFAIEQRNGAMWNTLGFVEGQGTTDRETSYAFTAEALTPGMNAFRLRQTDFDGTTSFSPIVEVAIVAEEDALTLVGANPFAGRTTARIAVTQPQAVTVELFDVTGRRVSTVFSGTVETFQSIDVDGTSLSTGMYILRATGERFTQSRTLIVVR